MIINSTSTRKKTKNELSVSQQNGACVLCVHYTLKKNVCISTDIFWRVFQILTKPVPYMFASINRRDNYITHCVVIPSIYGHKRIRDRFRQNTENSPENICGYTDDFSTVYANERRRRQCARRAMRISPELRRLVLRLSRWQKDYNDRVTPEKLFQADRTGGRIEQSGWVDQPASQSAVERTCNQRCHWMAPRRRRRVYFK